MNVCLNKTRLLIIFIAIILSISILGCSNIIGKASSILGDKPIQITRTISDNHVTLNILQGSIDPDEIILVVEHLPEGIVFDENSIIPTPMIISSQDNIIAWIFTPNPDKQLGDLTIYQSIPSTITYDIQGSLSADMYFIGKWGLNVSGEDGFIIGDYSPTYCGDGICDTDENLTSCSQDCSVCGDTSCTGSETCSTCPADCGTCPASTSTGGGGGGGSSTVKPQCNDRIDNDNDGKVDYPDDPGCDSYQDNDETDEVCLEQWICSSWSECQKGTQTRLCEDWNDCGTETNKPIEQKGCLEEEPAAVQTCNDNIKNQGEEDIDCGGPCEPCIKPQEPIVQEPRSRTGLYIGLVIFIILISIAIILIVERHRKNPNLRKK